MVKSSLIVSIVEDVLVFAVHKMTVWYVFLAVIRKVKTCKLSYSLFCHIEAQLVYYQLKCRRARNLLLGTKNEQFVLTHLTLQSP